VPGGYGFEVERGGVVFDISGVYTFIARDRVTEIGQDPGTGRLILTLGCECHARAEAFGSDWIVIDIVDGAPEAGTPFEEPLGDAAGAPREARSPRPRPAAPGGDAPPLALGNSASGSPASGTPVSDTAAELPLPAPLPRENPIFPAETRTAGSWRSAPRDPEGGGARPGGAEEPGGISPAPGATAGPDASAFEVAPFAATIPPWAALETALGGSSPGQGGPLAGVLETQTRPHDLAAQEELLLLELARAAAQGLVEANLPDLEAAEASAEPRPAEEESAEPPPPAPEDHVRLEAETSIDRDAGAPRGAGTVTSEGGACLPDVYFEIDAWGGEGDPARLLAEARQNLVGEFDRPDPVRVAALAKLYLHLGFGAEAKAVIHSFGLEAPETALLEALASVLDGEAEGLPGPLAGQEGCAGAVALWAVLAQGGAARLPHRTIDTRALLAAFSTLPIHLRRHLGPPLAESFLEAGDQVTAIAIRNAVARAPGGHGAAFELFEARLGLAEGDPEAPSELEALVPDDDALAPAAYADFLSAELAAGRVPADAAVTASALAFEIAGTDEGAELADLALRSALAAGDFAQAVREIERHAEAGGAGTDSLWRAFAEALAAGAQDEVFLREAYAHRAALAPAVAGSPAAPVFAKRLSGLGFPEEALRYLPSSEAGTESRLARAEALVASGSPAAAFGTLAGISGAEAERLRAEALMALGDARGASERFSQAGEPEKSDRAAWIAGAWDLLADSENEALRAFAESRRSGGGASGAAPEDAGDSVVASTADTSAPDSGNPARGEPGSADGAEAQAEAAGAIPPDAAIAPEAQVGRADRARAALAASESARARLDAVLSGARE
jgi:hypothetical protein